jgi:hypothetical protein
LDSRFFDKAKVDKNPADVEEVGGVALDVLRHSRALFEKVAVKVGAEHIEHAFGDADLLVRKTETVRADRRLFGPKVAKVDVHKPTRVATDQDVVEMPVSETEKKRQHAV